MEDMTGAESAQLRKSAPSADVISAVLITCPHTGEPVETVLRLRPAAFEALRGDYSFRCSRCGQIHTWNKGEAWLRPVPPSAR